MSIRRPARRLRPARICALPLCFGALIAASAAQAQTPSAEDLASARALGTEGVRLAEANDCPNAVPKLEAAEKLFHAPTTLERLGECQIKLGRLVAGTESLNRVVREPLPPNAPAAFVAARQRAQTVLTPALPRIGKLRIHVDGPAPDKVTVTVDGAGVPSVLFDADRPTDPGDHEVKAVAPGYKDATTTVSLKEGATGEVALKLEPDPNAVVAVLPPGGVVAPVGPPVTPLSPATPEHASSGGGKGPAIVSLAIGGAGLIVGTVAGILALSTKSTLNGECGPSKTACPGGAQSDINSLSTKATVSTIGFGVGIVGGVVGIILLATSHGSETPQAPPSAGATALRVSPWIGLGSAGLEGSF